MQACGRLEREAHIRIGVAYNCTLDEAEQPWGQLCPTTARWRGWRVTSHSAYGILPDREDYSSLACRFRPHPQAARSRINWQHQTTLSSWLVQLR